VVLGPGYIEQAHTSDEYVEIQQVVKGAAIYRELMVGT
jgi:acetylornithine deacetylase/succinyl-diaminopimelate desuccinylase-like protein